MERLHTISEIARALDLPLTTVRYYRDTFAAYILAVGTGRSRLYPEETLAALRLVSESYSAGLDRDEIERRLVDGAASHPTLPDVEVHHQLARADYRELVTSLLEGEQERRELLWQMVREISRFGQAIEQQHFVLNELVEHLAQRADRQLPPGSSRPGQVHEPNPGTSPREETHRDDIDELRRALANEQELVERLRRSKLDLEHRTAAAEAELAELRAGERGIWNRIFGPDSEG
jgi:DNA-binding transcriptional MerR regulator